MAAEALWQPGPRGVLRALLPRPVDGGEARLPVGAHAVPALLLAVHHRYGGFLLFTHRLVLLLVTQSLDHRPGKGPLGLRDHLRTPYRPLHHQLTRHDQLHQRSDTPWPLTPKIGQSLRS